MAAKEFRGATQVENELGSLPVAIGVSSGTKDGSRMRRCDDGRIPFSMLLRTMLYAHFEARAEQALRRNGSQAHDQFGADHLQLSIKPGTASVHFADRGLLVQPKFATWFPLEVLHSVRDVNLFAIDPRFRQTAVQKHASRADKRATSNVFLISRLLANHHQSGSLASTAPFHLAEDGLGRPPVKITALTPLHR